MNTGFIKLHKKMIDWEWYTEGNTFRVFLHCLIKANYKEKKHRGTVIKRGEFITSYEILAIQTNLTVQKVRTSLRNLELTDEITRQSTSKGTKISICNYDTYQTVDSTDNTPINTPSNTQTTNDQQSNNNQSTTTKEEIVDTVVSTISKEEEEEESSAHTRDYLSELTVKTKQHALTLKMKDSDYQEFLFYWMTPSEYDNLPRWYKGEFFDGLSKIKNWLNGVESKAEETDIEKYMRKLREEDEDNDE